VVCDGDHVVHERICGEWTGTDRRCPSPALVDENQLMGLVKSLGERFDHMVGTQPGPPGATTIGTP
jgi:hypothetical protein